MKIGIDIHGVLDKEPTFFAELTNILWTAGHEVHIITGVTVNPENRIGKETLKFLEDLNIAYTHLFSIVDYHKSIGTEIEYPDGSDNPWMDGELWDRTKADYCEKHKIDMMFDDTRRYGNYFKTPFVHFLSIDTAK